jgi:FMN phosphatase YigB (HAD superfamily)
MTIKALVFDAYGTLYDEIMMLPVVMLAAPLIRSVSFHLTNSE